MARCTNDTNDCQCLLIGGLCLTRASGGHNWSTTPVVLGKYKRPLHYYVLLDSRMNELMAQELKVCPARQSHLFKRCSLGSCKMYLQFEKGEEQLPAFVCISTTNQSFAFFQVFYIIIISLCCCSFRRRRRTLPEPPCPLQTTPTDLDWFPGHVLEDSSWWDEETRGNYQTGKRTHYVYLCHGAPESCWLTRYLSGSN